MQVDTVMAYAPNVDEPACDPPSLRLYCGQYVDCHDCGHSQLDGEMAFRHFLRCQDHARIDQRVMRIRCSKTTLDRS